MPVPSRVTSSRPKHQKEEVSSEESGDEDAETDGRYGRVYQVVVKFSRSEIGGLLNMTLVEIVLAERVSGRTLSTKERSVERLNPGDTENNDVLQQPKQ